MIWKSILTKMPTPRLLLIGVFAFVLSACAPDEPIGPSLNGTSVRPSLQPSSSIQLNDGRDAVRVPFKLKAVGIGTDASAEPPCDDGFFPTGNLAHGTATHLGRFTSVHRQCVNFETLEFRNGTVTWHAANGDQLYATFKGFLSTTSEPGVLTFDNPAPVVGGTGRFLGAEGVLRARGIVNINDGSFESRVEGYLLLPK